jgi:hypothetical protein
VTRLAVLGSPIAHSQSPALHTAAYAALGLDWQYDAVEVTGATLADFVASRDASWRGLSLTMPLKRDVLPLLQTTGGRDGGSHRTRPGARGRYCSRRHRTPSHLSVHNHCGGWHELVIARPCRMRAGSFSESPGL